MKRMIAVVAVTAFLVVGFAGCKREGPMEKAGEKIDEAVDDVTHPNEGPLEKAGRKTEEAIDDVKEELE